MTTTENPAVLPLRVIKVGACPSLSGRSTLSYQIGVQGEGPRSDLVLRVLANTGGGYFSKEWVSFAAVNALLLPDASMTFMTLQPLFEGRSVNTGGFLMAVLKGLNLITPKEDDPRCHERGDVDAFLAEMQGLFATSVSLGEDARPEGGKGKRKTLTISKSTDQSLPVRPKPNKAALEI